MKKSILIIGAGPGLSQAVAEKFGMHGFTVCLVSRNAENLKNLKKNLVAKGIDVNYAVADAGNTKELTDSITSLKRETGGFDMVLYNAAIIKQKDILDETPEQLTKEFTVNVANAVGTLQAVIEELKKRCGAFLLTGASLAIHPNAQYGSLSLGKAGIRNLAYQLHDRLKDDGIFVGLLSISGSINAESATHNPGMLADDFYTLYVERSNIEILR